MSARAVPSQLALAVDPEETEFERLDRVISEYVAGVDERIDYFRSTKQDCIDDWYLCTDERTRAMMMLNLDIDISMCKSPARKKFARNLVRRLKGLDEFRGLLRRAP